MPPDIRPSAPSTASSTAQPAIRHDALFHALGEPNRRRILEILRNGECSAGEIVTAFDISFAALSQHFAVLLEAGLVARRREGRYQFYSIRPEGIRLVHDWAGSFHEFWETKLDGLSTYLEQNEKP